MTGLNLSDVRELLSTGIPQKYVSGADELIYEITGGVPLFVREFAQTLLILQRTFG